MRHYLLLSTCPSMEVAEALAEMLVTEKLAACVNILPGAHSIYEWKGKVEKEQEFVLLIKSRKDRLQRLEERLLAEHPYELPELIAVPIESGLASYLTWIDTQLD
ncbi:MAG: divalent-cation tolerance protein CutA [Dehalococcoidia bacterium]